MGGDVVIVVPSLDHQLVPAITQSHSHHICIDAEVDVEPNSPKTITESSSKFCCVFHTNIIIIIILLLCECTCLSLITLKITIHIPNELLFRIKKIYKKLCFLLPKIIPKFTVQVLHLIQL